MTDNDICVICKGVRKFIDNTCMFCNGTGDWNQATEEYLKNHICQCECCDEKWCLVCRKLCHHDMTNSSAQFIVTGFDVISNVVISTVTSTTN